MSEFFKSRQRDLDSRDFVIADSTPKVQPKQTDLSHLRPDKKIRGD